MCLCVPAGSTGWIISPSQCPTEILVGGVGGGRNASDSYIFRGLCKVRESVSPLFKLGSRGRPQSRRCLTSPQCDPLSVAFRGCHVLLGTKGSAVGTNSAATTSWWPQWGARGESAFNPGSGVMKSKRRQGASHLACTQSKHEGRAIAPPQKGTPHLLGSRMGGHCPKHHFPR